MLSGRLHKEILSNFKFSKRKPSFITIFDYLDENLPLDAKHKVIIVK